MENDNPLVSVIITTKNEENNIENCLKSIKAQTYPEGMIEIIVVDNFSLDNTKQIVLRYTDKVFDKGPERSAQRNFGVAKSNGEYFLYLDADMILAENVISDCLKTIASDPNIVALYVSEVVMGKKFFSKVRRFERSFYDGTVIDCARFIKKSAFEQAGGFDQTLTGPEDWDLDKKLRNIGKVGLVSTPIYHNEAEFDLTKYLRKKNYYAKSFASYALKWGTDDQDIKKQLGFYYRFWGVFIEKGKWQKLLAHPFLTIGMYYLRFCVGWNYLMKNKGGKL